MASIVRFERWSLKLLEEAYNLPAYVPLVEVVSGLLVKAQEWLKSAGNAASQVGLGFRDLRTLNPVSCQ